jgi:hypothetical protein
MYFLATVGVVVEINAIGSYYYNYKPQVSEPLPKYEYEFMHMEAARLQALRPPRPRTAAEARADVERARRALEASRQQERRRPIEPAQRGNERYYTWLELEKAETFGNKPDVNDQLNEFRILAIGEEYMMKSDRIRLNGYKAPPAGSQIYSIESPAFLPRKTNIGQTPIARAGQLPLNTPVEPGHLGSSFRGYEVEIPAFGNTSRSTMFVEWQENIVLPQGAPPPIWTAWTRQ